MGRTREAALEAAVRAVAKYGSRKATMGDIAMLAGIAKATLYNHFRTRDEVYHAAIGAQVEAIAASARAKLTEGFGAGLVEAARLVAEHPAVRRVAVDEPAALARLATMDDGDCWTAVRKHVAAALRATGLADDAARVDLVVRYLGSQLLAPCAAQDLAEQVQLLSAGLAHPSASGAPVASRTEPDGAGSA